jgi:hypothetical protein
VRPDGSLKAWLSLVVREAFRRQNDTGYRPGQFTQMAEIEAFDCGDEGRSLKMRQPRAD